MNTENTNDFSKCKVGDKLWSIQFGDCEFVGIVEKVCNVDSVYNVKVKRHDGVVFVYTINGKWASTDVEQSLFFSNPNIIAPLKPPRLPEYKPGQWIAVWDRQMSIPILRKFIGFIDDDIHVTNGVSTEIGWEHHCSLEELPAVLEKWGEK